MKDSQAIVTPLGVSGANIELDSPDWFSWLSKRFSFSYQSAICDYTCNRRSNGKWYASKRKGDRSQGSKTLAQEYLGAGDKVTKAKLEEIARKFALPDRDYWYLKHPKPTEPTEAPGAGCTRKGTTKGEASSQNADEIAKLKARIAELENQDEELLTLQTESVRLQDENNELRVQLAKLKAEREELHTELGNQKGRAYKAEQRIEKLEAQIENSLPSGLGNKQVNAASLYNQLKPLLPVKMRDADKKAIQRKLEEILD